MTAASGADREEVRADFWQDYADGHPDAVAYVAASGADQPTLRDQLANEIRSRWVLRGDAGAGKIADALMPLIEADRDRREADLRADLAKSRASVEMLTNHVRTLRADRAAALRGKT